MEVRILRSATRRLRPCRSSPHILPSPRTVSQRRHASEQPFKQANPLGDYYAMLLEQPLPQIQSATRQPTSPTPTPSSDREELVAKAQVVFGSRLAGPAERKAEIEGKSAMIAGVLVPPKPEEPDNCCMSGCVNCVWDRFRDEIEEWAAAKAKATANLRKEKGSSDPSNLPGEKGSGLMLGEGEKGALHTAVSMDDDGGGSEANWGTGSETDLFEDIPVGIREFMKSEKRLKEKRLKEAAAGET